MSFSSQVKDDLTRVVTGKACCRQAEFVAFFLINGNIRFGAGKTVSLYMVTEHAATARKMYRLAHDFLPQREIAVYRRRQLNKNPVYHIVIPAQPAIKPFLTSVGLLDPASGWQIRRPEALEERFLQDDCCRRAYLRGAFLAAGSVADPEDAYHLEIANLDPVQAELLTRLLAGYDLPARTIHRKGGEWIYLKGAEQISDFLNVVGSHRSLLEFENVRVTKAVRNTANRLCNCDTANINKTVNAALRQQEDIRFILEQIGPETLPRPLLTIAELRLNYPSASLSELSDLSGLGRSALNHRFRRLTQIAENIRARGKTHWDDP